jgi:hypothetical protein
MGGGPLIMNYDIYIDLNDAREFKVPEPKVDIGIKLNGLVYHFSWKDFTDMVSERVDKLSGLSIQEK